MLIGLTGWEGSPTMVTLITEKLQNQSLDDLSCKTYNINLVANMVGWEALVLLGDILSTESHCWQIRLHGESMERIVVLHPHCSSVELKKSVSVFPYEINEDSPWKISNRACPIAELNKNSIFHFPVCPFSSGTPASFNLQWQNESTNTSMVSGWISELNLNDSFGQPLAPPTKRHCRSLSEPDELSRCRSPWKPGNSRVWTPISKRRCNSGGSATLQRCNSHCSATLQRSTSICMPQNPVSLNNGIFPASTCNTSPVPRPSSASSGFVDSSEGSTNSSVRWNSGGPCDFDPRRRLSLSQEHITENGDLLPSANSTPTSTPELSRRQGLLRCRSQPCVLNERKTRLKRRRDEDVRWTRPSLDFLKMTRTLKNSKSLCSLDYEEDDDPQLKTIVSSPCDSSDIMNLITPGSSPLKSFEDSRRLGSCHIKNARNYKREATVSESEEDTSDSESTEGTMFPLDCDLDLEQIENN